MKFINREEELSLLRECHRLSKRKLYSVAIYGERRIGKTRLLEEFLERDDLYFFVTKNKMSASLLNEFEDILREEGIISDLESLRTWDDFFNILFTRYKGTVVFDEFQNFGEVDLSIPGTLQKFIDWYENRRELLLVFSGSAIGLIKRLFGNSKEPLYGRLKRQTALRPLSTRSVVRMCKYLKIDTIEEIIRLYSVFGGVPKYYVSIEDENLEGADFDRIMDRFFFSRDALFEDEVMTILALEFGKRKGRYYDILAAISAGNTTISHISSYLSKKESGLTRYIGELLKYFEFIEQRKQVIGNKNMYIIINPLMNFWFRSFYRNLSAYKLRKSVFIEKVKRDLNLFVAERFEEFCREILWQRPIFEFDDLGKQWGRIPDAPKGKNQYEIDIVGINDKAKQILFAECKWQEDVDAYQVLDSLRDKARFVDWNTDSRRENFAVFAKSFRKKAPPNDTYLFDLDDIKKILK